MLFLYVGSEAGTSGYSLKHMTNVCEPEDDKYRPESQSSEVLSIPWTPSLIPILSPLPLSTCLSPTFCVSTL